MPTTNMISIPWDDGYARTFDRDNLQTAYLYFLDAIADGHSGLTAARVTACRLDADEAVPDTERITLAVAARICHDNNIEP